MFEKAKSFQARHHAPFGGVNAPEWAHLRGTASEDAEGRLAPRATRRAGDALRAVEWSELTARLNAARDLRLLLRTESQAPIVAVAASFGDAAASYFALLDHGEPDVNPDALGQSKGPGERVDASDVTRPDETTVSRSDATRGAARDTR